MSLQSQSFPLDHFGVIAASLFSDLLAQHSDKRKRRVAFNNLARLVKATKQLPKDAEIKAISLETDYAGQIYYNFQYARKEPVTTVVLPEAQGFTGTDSYRGGNYVSDKSSS